MEHLEDCIDKNDELVFQCTNGHPVPVTMAAAALHTAIGTPLSCPTCGPLNPRAGYQH